MFSMIQYVIMGLVINLVIGLMWRINKVISQAGKIPRAEKAQQAAPGTSGVSSAPIPLPENFGTQGPSYVPTLARQTEGAGVKSDIEIASLEELFTQDDWDALLESGDIDRDEHDVWSGLTEDYQLDRDWDSHVLRTAASLANEANLGIEQARELRKEIISHGGIAPEYTERWDGKKHVKRYTEEYTDIPAKYHRKDGFTIDCIAQEMGYEDDKELIIAIEKAEAILGKLPIIRGKRLSKFRIKDFIGEAEEILGNEHGRIIEEERSNEKVPF